MEALLYVGTFLLLLILGSTLEDYKNPILKYTGGKIIMFYQLIIFATLGILFLVAMIAKYIFVTFIVARWVYCIYLRNNKLTVR
jgi:hypothetical protein